MRLLAWAARVGGWRAIPRAEAGAGGDLGGLNDSGQQIGQPPQALIGREPSPEASNRPLLPTLAQ